MLIEYNRPKSISEALDLLARKQPVTYPLGGGTFLNRGIEGPFAVVDLQALGLSKITKKGNMFQVGATVTLQQLLDYKGLSEDAYNSIKYEASYNLRQIATLAGTLVKADGRSPITTLLLALDASLEIHEHNTATAQVKLGDWLPFRSRTNPGKLITKISFPGDVKVAYEYIARTPADQPILCAAISQWTSGRTRFTLGGWGDVPILAMDGPSADGIEIVGKNAYRNANDEWASAEYRSEMAGILALRGLKRLNPE